MSLITDIEAFFTDSGVAATFKGTAISVVFDNAYKVIDALTGGIASSAPQAICKSADVAAAVPGDTLIIGSTTYYVTEVEPDGSGITVLTLSKDA